MRLCIRCGFFFCVQNTSIDNISVLVDNVQKEQGKNEKYSKNSQILEH